MLILFVDLTNINKNMDKYKNWYNNICKRGQTRVTDEYTERHHIVPESFYAIRKRKGPAGWLKGDSDDASNITHLTDREHELVHFLLTKIYKDNKQAYFKVLKAYEMRSVVNHNQVSNRHFSSRRLEGIRAARAKLQSDAMKGAGNPMYNKHHTDKAKETIRQKNTGNKLTKEQHARLVANTTGKKKPPITDEHRKKLSKNHKSTKPGFDGSHSNATKEKMRAKATGRKQSEETIKAKADAVRGSKREKKLCEHCNRLIAVNGYARFHGDKCKDKK